jgi:hypothetical protein
MAYLNDQTEQGCVTATDEDGNQCEWCSVAGMSNVCLTPEQADMGAALGISCDDDTAGLLSIQDPYDTTCAIAYLSDQSEEACVSTVNEDDAACEYCSMQGSINVCLTPEQAEMAEQLGLDCASDDAVDDLQDPYDPSCMLAYLQDQSMEACVAAADADGNSCEFCSLQGSINLCLTSEQASYGEQIGITCDAKPMTITVVSPALSAALRAAFLLNLKIRHDLVLYLPTTLFLSATVLIVCGTHFGKYNNYFQKM